MNMPSADTAILSKLECYPGVVSELYSEASQLFSSGNFSEAVDKVEAALKELDGYQEEDKQTWGFAELQLLYGRSLLEIIKCSASKNDEIFGPKVPKVVGLPGTETEETEEPEETEEGEEDEIFYEKEDNMLDETNGETDGTDTEDLRNDENSLNLEERRKSPAESEAPSDSVFPPTEEQQVIEERDSEVCEQSEDEEQDIRELAWEQLECARVILASKLPESRLRLAVVFEALGDFGLENDNNEQAAEDFKSAVKCYEEAGYQYSRMVGGLYHSIYLALRSIDPYNAMKYLKLAAQVFEKRILENQKTREGQAGDIQETSDDEKEILSEIELEIADFESLISNQEKENSTFPKNDKLAQVTIVEPRKRSETHKDSSQEHKIAFYETTDERSNELVSNKRIKTCEKNKDLSTDS